MAVNEALHALVPGPEEIQRNVHLWVARGARLPSTSVVPQSTGYGGHAIVDETVGPFGRTGGSGSRAPFVTIMNSPYQVMGVPLGTTFTVRQEFGAQFYGARAYERAVLFRAWVETPDAIYFASKLGFTLAGVDDVVRVDEEVGKTMEMRAIVDFDIGYGMAMVRRETIDDKVVDAILDDPFDIHISTSVSLIGGGGAGARVQPVVDLGGSGYSVAPTVSFSGGDPETPASATAMIDEDTGKVEVITVNEKGNRYTSVPTVMIDGNATGRAVMVDQIEDGIVPGEYYRVDRVELNGPIGSISVLDGGGGYTSAPQVEISGIVGSGASAYALLDGDQVDEIVVVDGGSGYESEYVGVFT